MKTRSEYQNKGMLWWKYLEWSWLAMDNDKKAKKYDPDLSKVIMVQNRIGSKYQMPSNFGNLRNILYEANLIRSKPIRE